MFLSDKERTETIWACRFCMMCHVADRVAAVVRRESYTPRGRGAILYALEKSFLEWDEAVADIMYTSLNDGLLQQWCVGNYDHEELVLDARAKLFEKGLAPEEISSFAKKLRDGEGRNGGMKEVLAGAGVVLDFSADTLLFCGCTARDSEQSTVIAMGRLFNKASVKFKILSDEPCCGWPLYQIGDLTGAAGLSVSIAKEIKASGVSKVVVLDADCFRMLLTRTSRFGGNLEGVKIVHATQELALWLEEKMIPVPAPITETVTYHDPCALARYCDEEEAPRRILAAIMEHELVEMPTNRKLANCCGAGGMLPLHRREVAEKVALMRLQEARETGASLISTACCRCTAILSSVLTSECTEKPLKVRNLVEMAAQAAGL